MNSLIELVECGGECWTDEGLRAEYYRSLHAFKAQRSHYVMIYSELQIHTSATYIPKSFQHKPRPQTILKISLVDTTDRHYHSAGLL